MLTVFTGRGRAQGIQRAQGGSTLEVRWGGPLSWGAYPQGRPWEKSWGAGSSSGAASRRPVRMCKAQHRAGRQAQGELSVCLWGARGSVPPGTSRSCRETPSDHPLGGWVAGAFIHPPSPLRAGSVEGPPLGRCICCWRKHAGREERSGHFTPWRSAGMGCCHRTTQVGQGAFKEETLELGLEQSVGIGQPRRAWGMVHPGSGNREEESGRREPR